jgi:alkylation response protein AidB-like acyl-CoA dehydrogenase
MDFSLTEEQKRFQQRIARFLQEELAPWVGEIEAAHEFPMSFYKKLADHNLLGINFPKEYGGWEADCITCALLIEEISKFSSGVAGCVTTASMTGPTILLISGSEEQKKKYLHGVTTGETITAFAITEADAGSDISRLSTYVVEENDCYRINGTKIFITNGSVATIFLVLAKTDNRDKEFSLFLIERGTPGLSISKKFDKLGWSSQDTTEVSMDDVVIPKENLVGAKGEGLSKAFDCINFTRILLASTALGVAESALNHAMAYANNKQQMGKPLIKQQGIRSSFAKMATEIEAARNLVYRAAWMQDRGLRNRKEAAMAKFYATEMAKHLTKETLRLHGMDGFFTRHQAAIFFSDTPVFTIADGTSEIQLENISRELGLLKSGEMGEDR